MASHGSADVSAGTKRVLFVRHAEGVHNATENWDIPDPELTVKGVGQAQALHAALAARGVFPELELIVVSPLRRTLRTALLAFPTGIPRLVSALHRERWSGRCDEGSSAPALCAALPDVATWPGLDTLGDGWWASAPEDVPARALAFRRWLVARPESTLAVVGHGAFSKVLLGHDMNKTEAVWAEVSGPDGAISILHGPSVHAGFTQMAAMSDEMGGGFQITPLEWSPSLGLVRLFDRHPLAPPRTQDPQTNSDDTGTPK
jgi:broad specificity phosphatase PhoE